jgi:hypothetical protein
MALCVSVFFSKLFNEVRAFLEKLVLVKFILNALRLPVIDKARCDGIDAVCRP